MRLVKIQPCSPELYFRIRNIIYELIPFALINQGYCPEESMAIFYFWDSDYIPDSLQGYIVQPPIKRENKKKLKKKIEEVLL